MKTKIITRQRRQALSLHHLHAICDHNITLHRLSAGPRLMQQ
jgi:hypothetical protein